LGGPDVALHFTEGAARVADSEVCDPTGQRGIDLRDHLRQGNCSTMPDEERFVLRFPAKTRDGAVVAAAVHVAAKMSVDMSANTDCRLLGGVGLHVGEDGGVRNGFNESCAEHGSGDAENDVGIAALAGERISGGDEIELGNVAAGGAGSAGDDEKGVHVAVGDTVGLLEARFADWAIGSDEPGDDVLCTVQSGDRDQRIPRGARAA